MFLKKLSTVQLWSMTLRALPWWSNGRELLVLPKLSGVVIPNYPIDALLKQIHTIQYAFPGFRTIFPTLQGGWRMDLPFRYLASKIWVYNPWALPWILHLSLASNVWYILAEFLNPNLSLVLGLQTKSHWQRWTLFLVVDPPQKKFLLSLSKSAQVFMCNLAVCIVKTCIVVVTAWIKVARPA